jgi:hypothetical protein
MLNVPPTSRARISGSTPVSSSLGEAGAGVVDVGDADGVGEGVDSTVLVAGASLVGSTVGCSRTIVVVGDASISRACAPVWGVHTVAITVATTMKPAYQSFFMIVLLQCPAFHPAFVAALA